uniref:DUF3050 domain-containing protein n=1 Tax=Candidatus Kentrum sp. DK TaxID=2126562 RepID=A0A450RUL8_9GAMM|nr:MAG: Protein of unknown function (DUF3050) [Candidatus Kentron sp. DK]
MQPLTQPVREIHDRLARHPLYGRLTDLENLRIFMKYHVFAVWDFMSLLKSLQRQVTGLEVPWMEAPVDPRLTRLINEIVLGEESDLDHEGHPCSHFSLYLKAMDEVGADTAPVLAFVGKRDFSLLPPALADIVGYHLDLAARGEVHAVAASFFHGRERIIPRMFGSIMEVLTRTDLQCQSLLYYLRRHIELDSQEHGPMALECLNILCDTETKRERAEQVAVESLRKREVLWDFIAGEMDVSR